MRTSISADLRRSLKDTSVPEGPRRQMRRQRSARLLGFAPATSSTMSPTLTPARSAGPPGARPATTSFDPASVVYMPSHGRDSRDERPSFSMSSRIGSSRSIGTSMLPCRVPASTFSCTSSDPMARSLPSEPISAEPPHCGCAGAV